jgi:hypothetical protein
MTKTVHFFQFYEYIAFHRKTLGIALHCSQLDVLLFSTLFPFESTSAKYLSFATVISFSVTGRLILPLLTYSQMESSFFVVFDPE